MPDHLDIPLDRLLIYDGDELIFDGSDPATYVLCHTAEDIRRALEPADQDHGEHARDR
jgi:hypothetical protein